MFTFSRLSKKTFFAAAALGAAAVLPAQALVIADIVGDTAYADTDTNDYFLSSWQETWTRFVKTGSGRLEVTSLGAAGTNLYNLHEFGVTPHNDSDTDGPYYFRDRYSGSISQTAANYTYRYEDATSMSLLTNISFGEVVVEEGVLNITGFVNAWHDFGSNFNQYSSGAQNSHYSQSQRTNGFMAGVSKITVNNGTTLDLSGNNNFSNEDLGDIGMIATGSRTTYQFLHNLQSGELGSDTASNLVLGDIADFHVNIHIDDWSENTRSQTSTGVYFDNALVFGGSIGTISGAGSIYKTGEGTFTLLNSNATFTGSLYAAGGSLVLAADNTIGSVYSYTDAAGNTIRAQVSSSVENAASVNIAGTYNSGKLATGGSMQGSAVALNETYQTVTWQDSNDNTHEEVYTAIKESFFTTPSAGTLVIAENQVISNFQALFAAGYSVTDGTTAADAVLAAANNDGTLSSWSNGAAGTSDAPIIAGTGIGSFLVVPGGIYAKDESGEYDTSELITDDYGYIKGGLLVIDQDAGNGGVYEGSIVGCRVSIYNKTAFAELTSDTEDSESPDAETNRKDQVRLTLEKIEQDKLAIGLTDEEYVAFAADFDEEDGSFALDSDAAWKVVEYYKESHDGNFYYVDYIADASVKGGLVVLKGAGDIALLLESANYSGLHIDEDRTGKTVLNITSINTMAGSVVALGGSVSLVSDLDNTLDVELDFAAGTSLVFTTADTISTLSGTIRVGDVRKSLIGFSVVQDLVYGDVYVERGIGLNFTGTDEIFANAGSLTIWEGSLIPNTSTAAASIALLGDARQTINNLTGDSTAQITLGTGALTVNITSNDVDGRSGLTRGVYDGGISGAASLIKGGDGVFTLGGGTSNRAFTGDVSVGQGSLSVSVSNGLTGASALILNTGTSASLTGDQTLRTLFGASDAVLTVTDGTLTLGANSKAANGEYRPLVSNNLGLSTAADSLDGISDVSQAFARFVNGFDKEGNKIYDESSTFSFTTQAEATSAYLTATAKLAYSGFDASALEQFVGVKDYAGKVIFSKDDYSTLLSEAKSGTLLIDEENGNQLSALADTYAELSQAKYFSDNIKKISDTGSTYSGYYDPSALLRSWFSSDDEYQQYLGDKFESAVLKEYIALGYGDKENPAFPKNPTTAQKNQINEALYKTICSEYERLSSEAEKDDLRTAFSSAAAARAKFAADFGAIENLGGTDLVDADAQKEIDVAVNAYGAALDEYAALRTQIAAETDTEKKAALQEEADALYAEIYDEDGLLDGVVAVYLDIADQAETIENKQQFAGIVIPGAFANSVTVDGTLVDADGWVGDLAFAGTIETASLVKTGDNTVKLTGSLKGLGRLVVNAGTLELGDGTLSESEVSEGISVSRGANLSVSASGEDKTFDYAVSGAGNFVKTGSGKLTLGGNVLYTGTTTVREGVLQLTLRAPEYDENETYVAAQGNIYLAGDGVSVILDQGSDITWNQDILAVDPDASDDTETAQGVSVEKMGEGALTLSGSVSLGDNAVLAVKGGELILTGEFSSGENASLSVAEGSRLALTSFDVPGSSVRISGAGAFDIGTDSVAGNVALVGESMDDTEEKFSGTVTVRSNSELTLSGSSVFDEARGVVLNSRARLVLTDGTTQKIQSLSGDASSTVSLDAGTVLELRNDTGSRVSMDYSSGYYVFDESVLLDAPNFAGTVSGRGTMLVSGKGLFSFSGSVLSEIKVSDGGQIAVEYSGGGLSVSVDSSDAEVLLSVGVGKEHELVSGSLSFAGGIFGKIGDGTLRVNSSDFDGCDGVSVYEGTLSVSGWTENLKKTIADGATLSVELDADERPSFKEVVGSGTLELLLTQDLAVSGNGDSDVLPVEYQANGLFFNGKISFDSDSDEIVSVALDSVEIASVNTTENISLTLANGVVLKQTQNSRIEGELHISGNVLVEGAGADAGTSTTAAARRLTVVKDFDVPAGATFSLKNVGFEFGSGQDISVVVDQESEANTFYFSMASGTSGSVAAENAVIGVDIDVNPADPNATSKLRELSLIKTGEGTLTVAGGTLSSALGDQDAGGSDPIFGVSADVYDQLQKNGGTLNIGAEQGTFVLTGIGDFTGTTANGVSVNLLTLRSTVAATAGTIEIASGEPAASAEKSLAFFADAADASSGMQELSRSISGTGNVEFSGSAGTLVTAAQEYTGDTTVSGLVEFSGDGRKSRSALITVADGGVLRGGVEMQARSVSYSGTAVRNMNEMGAAGSTTLKLTISDSRLPKDIVLQLDVGTDGQVEVGSAAVLSSASLTELGLSVESVEISDGNLEIEITDSAYAGGSETYTVSIDMDSVTLPTAVGESKTLSGSTSVAGTFVAESGGSVSLDATAGDLISAGTVILESGSRLTIENIGDSSVLGKSLSIIKATTIGNGTDSYAYDGSNVEDKIKRSNIVAEALREGGVSADTPIMVFTDDSGTISAKRIISDFSALGVDYDDGIDGSFLDAISRIASADDGNFEITEGVLNADALQDASGADVFNLFFALNSISSDALADEVSRLSPLGYASMLAMPVSVFNSDIARLRGRLDQRRYDAANPLRESGEYEFFVYAQSDFAENGSDRDSPVFDYNLYGATAGYDWKPNYETTLGVAVGYTYGKAKIRNGGGNVKMDDMRVTAFASRLFGNFYLDVGAQLGFADFDAHRNTIAGSADGDTHALLAGGFATFGAAFALWQDKKDGSGLYFTPNVGLSYMHADISDFGESGTAGLDIDDADGDSLRLRVAAGLQWVFPCAEWEMRLGLEAAYAHEFLGEELDIDGSFANWNNSAFSVSGKALATDTFSIGPTADLRLSDRDSIYCGYGIEFGTDSGISQNVSIGYRRRF